MLRGIEFWPLQ